VLLLCVLFRRDFQLWVSSFGVCWTLLWVSLTDNLSLYQTLTPLFLPSLPLLCAQVLGVDCPSTGVLMDVSFLSDSGETTTKRNAICVFESVAQTPLRRHSNGDDYAGLAMHYLVVREVR
jgi:hypothetical protein